MGRSQRDKGLRAEREFARIIGGERVPLSGAAGGRFVGDVIDSDGRRWEVKVRKDGFKMLYKWIENVDFLAIRSDRSEWLVVLRIDDYLRLVGDERGKTSER